MYFPTYFKRQKGSASADPVLGTTSDPLPVFLDGFLKAGKWADAVMSTKVGGIGNPIKRVAVGYRFDDGAAGTGGDLTATLWAFDRNSSKWYKADTGTLKDGAITFFKAPYLADPPQTNANVAKPSAGGADLMLVVADPGGGAATGIYHFVMGPDLADF